MEDEKSSGEILDEIAARYAAADLVRDEIRRLERVIVELEEGAVYRANVGLGREFGEQAIAHCRTHHDTPGIRAAAERLLASLNGTSAGVSRDSSVRGTTTADSAPPVAGGVTQERPRAVDPAPPATAPSPVQVAARTAPAVPSPSPSPAPDTFFGIKVPEKQLHRVDEILADARAKAELGTIATETNYERSTGKNIWRKKLFYAAYESYRDEFGPPDEDEEPGHDSSPRPSPSPASTEKEKPPVMQSAPDNASVENETQPPAESQDVEFGPSLEDDATATEGEPPVEELGEDELPAFLFEETPETPKKASWDDPYANGGASARMEPTEKQPPEPEAKDDAGAPSSRPKPIPPPKGVPRPPGVRVGLGMNVDFFEGGKDLAKSGSSGGSR